MHHLSFTTFVSYCYLWLHIFFNGYNPPSIFSLPFSTFSSNPFFWNILHPPFQRLNKIFLFHKIVGMRLNFFFFGGGDSLASVDNFNKAIFYFKNDEKIKSENLWVCDVLRRNRKRPVVWNGFNNFWRNSIKLGFGTTNRNKSHFCC